MFPSYPALPGKTGEFSQTGIFGAYLHGKQ
jgi:hypothetical protein